MIVDYSILYYDNEKSYGVSYSNQNNVLTEQLWKYYQDLGVEAYQADTDNLEETVKWRLRGHWYSTRQIERIYHLCAFL